jgi:hypothetical protein
VGEDEQVAEFGAANLIDIQILDKIVEFNESYESDNNTQED